MWMPPRQMSNSPHPPTIVPSNASPFMQHDNNPNNTFSFPNNAHSNPSSPYMRPVANMSPHMSPMVPSLGGMGSDGNAASLNVPVGPRRERSKSETFTNRPWAFGVSPYGSDANLLLSGAQPPGAGLQYPPQLNQQQQGTVNPNDISPPLDSYIPQIPTLTPPAAPPHPASFGPGITNPMSASSQQTTFNDMLLGVDNNQSLRRARSDGGHRRGIQSEDLSRGNNRFLMPTNGFNFGHDGLLAPPQHPSLPSPEQFSRGREANGFHHRRASSGSHERRSSAASSARPSPYPSPTPSPLITYSDLPPDSMQDMNDLKIYDHSPAGYNQSLPQHLNEPSSKVLREHVTTRATVQASQVRRTSHAPFTCPVPGCGSTFTRHFNLKGEYRP